MSTVENCHAIKLMDYVTGKYLHILIKVPSYCLNFNDSFRGYLSKVYTEGSDCYSKI